MLVELAEFVHFVTRLKLVAADGARRRRSPRTSAAAAPNSPRQLSMPVLTRAWQLLLKGMQEVKTRRARSPPPTWFSCASPMPPICRRRTRRCAGSLPAPARAGARPRVRRQHQLLTRRRRGPRRGAARCRPAAPPHAAAAPPAPARRSDRARLASFEDIVARCAAGNRDIQLKLALERDVRARAFRRRLDRILARAGRLAATRAKSDAAACRNGPGGAGWSRSSNERRRAERSRSSARPRRQRRAEASCRSARASVPRTFSRRRNRRRARDRSRRAERGAAPEIAMPTKAYADQAYTEDDL